MKYHVSYLGVEKVTYEFDENDIRDALMEKFKVRREGLENDYNRRYELDVSHDEDTGRLSAELVVYYSKENPNPNA